MKDSSQIGQAIKAAQQIIKQCYDAIVAEQKPVTELTQGKAVNANLIIEQAIQYIRGECQNVQESLNQSSSNLALKRGLLIFVTFLHELEIVARDRKEKFQLEQQCRVAIAAEKAASAEGGPTSKESLAAIVEAYKLVVNARNALANICQAESQQLRQSPQSLLLGAEFKASKDLFNRLNAGTEARVRLRRQLRSKVRPVPKDFESMDVVLAPRGSADQALPGKEEAERLRQAALKSRATKPKPMFVPPLPLEVAYQQYQQVGISPITSVAAFTSGLSEGTQKPMGESERKRLEQIHARTHQKFEKMEEEALGADGWVTRELDQKLEEMMAAQGDDISPISPPSGILEGEDIGSYSRSSSASVSPVPIIAREDETIIEISTPSFKERIEAFQRDIEKLSNTTPDSQQLEKLKSEFKGIVKEYRGLGSKVDKEGTALLKSLVTGMEKKLEKRSSKWSSFVKACKTIVGKFIDNPWSKKSQLFDHLLKKHSIKPENAIKRHSREI